MNNVKYRSGNFTVAMPVSMLHSEQPLLPELNEVLIFHQDFMQLIDYFAPLDYNTPNPDVLAGAYLFDESPRADLGGGVCKWTRSWASIPSTYGKAGGVYPYVFPGFDYSNSPDSGTDRVTSPRPIPVAMEILREFFLCGTAGVYASWQQIPITKAFKIYNIDETDPTDTSDTDDTLRDPRINPDGTLRIDPDDGTVDAGTSPSLTQYKAMIAAGQTIQVEDQKVTNWRGGIYVRETYTVVAQ